jgi:hypothetical protein
MTARLAGALLLQLACACSSMLPRSTETTESPWDSYADVQATFNLIEPGYTTSEELAFLHLDPATNANIGILNYSDVLRRFLINPSVTLADLDHGVRECISAKIDCRGYEINQSSVQKHRNGSFWLDFLGFRKETHTAGWRFNGLILLKDGVVIYKLTGGQPSILQQEKTTTPLGPVQGVGDRLFGALLPQ